MKTWYFVNMPWFLIASITLALATPAELRSNSLTHSLTHLPNCPLTYYFIYLLTRFLARFLLTQGHWTRKCHADISWRTNVILQNANAHFHLFSSFIPFSHLLSVFPLYYRRLSKHLHFWEYRWTLFYRTRKYQIIYFWWYMIQI